MFEHSSSSSSSLSKPTSSSKLNKSSSSSIEVKQSEQVKQFEDVEQCEYDEQMSIRSTTKYHCINSAEFTSPHLLINFALPNQMCLSMDRAFSSGGNSSIIRSQMCWGQWDSHKIHSVDQENCMWWYDPLWLSKTRCYQWDTHEILTMRSSISLDQNIVSANISGIRI